MNVPLDHTHRACVDARDGIRAAFTELRYWAAQWQPRPCPPKPRWPT